MRSAQHEKPSRTRREQQTAHPHREARRTQHLKRSGNTKTDAARTIEQQTHTEKTRHREAHAATHEEQTYTKTAHTPKQRTQRPPQRPAPANAGASSLLQSSATTPRSRPPWLAQNNRMLRKRSQRVLRPRTAAGHPCPASCGVVPLRRPPQSSRPRFGKWPKATNQYGFAARGVPRGVRASMPARSRERDRGRGGAVPR